MEEQRTLLVKPWTGFALGIVAACVMLAIPAVLRPEMSAATLLTGIAGTVLPDGIPRTASSLIVVGLAIHLIVGACLGWLYGASQAEARLKFVIAVGILYGVAISIVSRLLVARFADEGLASSIRSLPWFLACLVFGLSMGLLAHLTAKRAPAQTRTAARD